MPPVRRGALKVKRHGEHLCKCAGDALFARQLATRRPRYRPAVRVRTRYRLPAGPKGQTEPLAIASPRSRQLAPALSTKQSVAPTDTDKSASAATRLTSSGGTVCLSQCSSREPVYGTPAAASKVTSRAPPAHVCRLLGATLVAAERVVK